MLAHLMVDAGVGNHICLPMPHETHTGFWGFGQRTLSSTPSIRVETKFCMTRRILAKPPPKAPWLYSCWSVRNFLEASIQLCDDDSCCPTDGYPGPLWKDALD